MTMMRKIVILFQGWIDPFQPQEFEIVTFQLLVTSALYVPYLNVCIRTQVFRTAYVESEEDHEYEYASPSPKTTHTHRVP